MTEIIKAPDVWKNWHRYWSSPDNQRNNLREIKPGIEKWESSFHKNRKIETSLSKLRMGHTSLTPSYLLKGETNPPNVQQMQPAHNCQTSWCNALNFWKPVGNLITQHDNNAKGN